jgi:hypothetical protein
MRRTSRTINKRPAAHPEHGHIVREKHGPRRSTR